MADENSSSDNSPSRPRRSSITTNTLTALFGRPNAAAAPSAAQPGPINTNIAAGRRVSISSVGLSGSSPIQTSAFPFPRARRASISTAGSDSIDENAVDDDDGPARSQPTTPFTRRMSFGAQVLFSARGGGSPGSNGRPPPSSYTSSSPLSPIADQETSRERKPSSKQASTQSKPRTTSDYSSTRSAEGLNWSEQFRSRAESAINRPSFSTSPPNTMPRSPTATTHHERAKSFGDMPSPPTSTIPTQPSAPSQSALRRKPDAVGERMLRGDFYMD